MNEFIYAQYRANLRRNQHMKPRKERNMYRLERIFLFWPIFAIAWLAGRRRPEIIEAPSGAFSMPESEDA